MTSHANVVVDTSALLESFSPEPSKDLVRRLRTTSAVAPEIIDLEVLHALRRKARSGPHVTAEAEHDALQLPDAPIIRLSHRSLIQRVWELRHSITAYDAAYVALAEQLDVPLVTCDAKLAGSNGHKAEIELYSTN